MCDALHVTHKINVLYYRCHPVCRVYFHAAYYYLEDPPFVSHTVPTLPNSDWWKHKQESHVVTVDGFARHVANLHVDGDIGFSKEYEIIQEESMNFDFSTESSQLPENKSKNRYLNIVPCKLINYNKSCYCNPFIYFMRI